MENKISLLSSGPAAAPATRKSALNLHGFLGADSLPAERVRLQVSFRGKLHVGYGTYISPYDALEPPAVAVLPLATAEKGAAGSSTVGLYTVICIDPDPPLGLGQIIHMLRYNIVLGAPASSEESTTVFWHGPPGPPMNTGGHRYIYYAFEQKERLPADDKVLGQSSSVLTRMKFRLDRWVDHCSERGWIDPSPAGTACYVSEHECGCHRSTCFSIMCCAFCWTPPPKDWEARDSLRDSDPRRSWSLCGRLCCGCCPAGGEEGETEALQGTIRTNPLQSREQRVHAASGDRAGAPAPQDARSESSQARASHSQYGSTDVSDAQGPGHPAEQSVAVQGAENDAAPSASRSTGAVPTESIGNSEGGEGGSSAT